MSGLNAKNGLNAESPCADTKGDSILPPIGPKSATTAAESIGDVVNDDPRNRNAKCAAAGCAPRISEETLRAAWKAMQANCCLSKNVAEHLRDVGLKNQICSRNSMLNAGVPFGAVVISLFTPFSIVVSYRFYMRRDIQPIKARGPLLVLITDVILILYVMLLCFQRIFIDDYPCWLNLWSAYIGTITLFNTYMWRCWTLYFAYNNTEEKLKLDQKNAVAEGTDAPTKQADSFFFRNANLAKPEFLAQVAAAVTIVFMIPCFVATGLKDDAIGFNVREVKGITCDLGWTQTLLAVYVAIYVCFFAFFAYQLRSVADNFRIKDELRITGLIGIIAVIPWLLFNRVSSMRTINDDIFPFSTLSLIVAVFAAFWCSTVWPLQQTYSVPAHVTDDALEADVGNLEHLENILKLKAGFDSFRKFLSAEFSVENLLFWKDVEDFRQKIKAGLTEASICSENTRLYEKYIVDDGPFQVNLKEEIVKKIKAIVVDGGVLPKPVAEKSANPAAADAKDCPAVESLKDSGVTSAGVASADVKSADATMAPVSTQTVTIHMKDNRAPLAAEFPTCFDEAQAATFKLMKTDPFPRFKEHPAYTLLIEKRRSSTRRSTATKK